MRRRSLLIIGGLIAVACLGVVLVNVCADGGAMGSAYRACQCRGVEWEVYDRMAADGPRRTICLGLVRSRTCHATRDGPVVPCGS